MSLKEATPELAELLIAGKQEKDELNETTIELEKDDYLDQDDNTCGFWIFKGKFFQR